ncbi:MAG: AraC family transcriptional regulator [Spirochaetales bacterium]|nr:AraC family transcriptional regulator [Spirochaetales bacterium]
MKAGNEVRFIRDSSIEGIECCSVRNSLHVFPRHSHENLYAVSLMEKGGSYWNGRSRSASLVQPGELAIINPGEMHSGEPNKYGSTSYRMIYLDSSFLKRDGSIRQFANIISGDLRLKNLFIDLYNSIGKDIEPLAKEISLTAFTGYLSDHYSYPGVGSTTLSNDNPAVDRTREYISDNLNRNVPLEEMAEISSYSPYHFLRLFKAATGMTPHQYLTLKRVEKARELIMKGISPAEIAMKTGFTDQSHFTNTFRKFTGATPRQYFLSK